MDTQGIGWKRGEYKGIGRDGSVLIEGRKKHSSCGQYKWIDGG